MAKPRRPRASAYCRRFGEKGKFDEFGVFTPNILYAPSTDKYYLYYTGVRGDPSSDWEFEAFCGCIGAAVADRPNGGATGWTRVNQGDPLLAPRRDMQAAFDGWHVDDSVMFYRNQRYWLYRPDLTEPDAGPTMPLWGVSMTSYASDAGLQKFEILYDTD